MTVILLSKTVLIRNSSSGSFPLPGCCRPPEPEPDPPGPNPTLLPPTSPDGSDGSSTGVGRTPAPTPPPPGSAEGSFKIFKRKSLIFLPVILLLEIYIFIYWRIPYLRHLRGRMRHERWEDGCVDGAYDDRGVSARAKVGTRP